MTTERHEQAAEAARVNDLARLALSAEELRALARQGFVSREDRGGKRPIHKLRFRMNGRQIVKYVGTDPLVAESIRRAVTVLQQQHRWAREVRRLAAAAQALQRCTNRSLQPFLEAEGIRFHGWALRRVVSKRGRG